MNLIKSFLLVAIFIFCNSVIFAQEEPKQKSPEEYAATEAERLEKDLNLTPHQLFYIDSVLQHNFIAVSEEFDRMKAGGMQDSRNYKIGRAHV